MPYYRQPATPGSELTESQRFRILKGHDVYKRETRLEKLDILTRRLIKEAASLETAQNFLYGRHGTAFLRSEFYDTLARRMDGQYLRFRRLEAVREAECARAVAAKEAGLCPNCGAPKHQRGESCPFYATPVTFETTPED